MNIAPTHQPLPATRLDGAAAQTVAVWVPKGGATPSCIDSVTPHVPLVFDGGTHAGIDDAVRGARMFARETGTAVAVFHNGATDTWLIGALLVRNAQHPDGDTFEFDKRELKHGAFQRTELGATGADQLRAIVSTSADVRFA